MDDKKQRYQAIIQSILKQYAAYTPVNIAAVDNQIVIDSERRHFHLLRVGWQDDRFIRNTVFYFDIKPDGKIWIQANWTDTDIAARLVEEGVKKTDIVIGFQPPRYRPYTGYATT